MHTKSKLSLDSFKSKLPKNDERQRNLDKIVGGIMGQCHCVVDTFTHYKDGVVYMQVVYTVCN